MEREHPVTGSAHHAIHLDHLDDEHVGLGRRRRRRKALRLLALLALRATVDRRPARRARVGDRRRDGLRRARGGHRLGPGLVDGLELLDRPEHLHLLDHVPDARSGDLDQDVPVAAVVLGALHVPLAADLHPHRVADLATQLPAVPEVAPAVTGVLERAADLDPALPDRVDATLERLHATGLLVDGDDHVVGRLVLPDHLLDGQGDDLGRRGRRDRRRVGVGGDGLDCRDDLAVAVRAGLLSGTGRQYRRDAERPDRGEGGQNGHDEILAGHASPFRVVGA